MMIYTLTGQHKELFAPFIPEDVLMMMGIDGYYTLGLFDETGFDEPAGLIQFYSSFLDDDEKQPYLELTYLFVREEYRYNGGGAKLLQAVTDAAIKSGVVRITAQFSPSDEREPILIPGGEREVLSDAAELKRCLSNAGYTFEEGSRYSIVSTVADSCRSKLFEGDMSKEVVSLSMLGKKEWNDLFNTVDASTASGLRQIFLKDGIDIYDLDVSCAYVSGGAICGILLVKKLASGPVMISELREYHSKDPKVVLYLLKSAVAKAKKKYSPDQKILIESKTEASQRLIQKIFTEETPSPVIRAVKVL